MRSQVPGGGVTIGDPARTGVNVQERIERPS